MGWRVELLRGVVEAINGLSGSGKLSRSGAIRAYNALRFLLPHHARRYQQKRYASDPDCFCYTVGFIDLGVWHKFTFHINDSVAPGLLIVEGMTHETHPEVE